MTCSRVQLPGGETAIVCHGKSRKKCEFCSNPATLQCDHPIGETVGADPITCDAFICAQCATPKGDGIDHCPRHTIHAQKRTIRDPQTQLELERAGYRFFASGTCRACPARIEWFGTPKQNNIPMHRLGDDRLIPHFIDCPARAEFRSANRRHAARAEKPKPQQTSLF